MKLSNKMLNVDIVNFLWYEYKLSFISTVYRRSSKNEILKFSKLSMPRVIYLPLKNKYNGLVKLEFE